MSPRPLRRLSPDSNAIRHIDCRLDVQQCCSCPDDGPELHARRTGDATRDGGDDLLRRHSPGGSRGGRIGTLHSGGRPRCGLHRQLQGGSVRVSQSDRTIRLDTVRRHRLRRRRLARRFALAAASGDTGGHHKQRRGNVPPDHGRALRAPSWSGTPVSTIPRIESTKSRSTAGPPAYVHEACKFVE